MSICDIVMWPDERLSLPCDPVTDPTSVQDLVRDMFETMYNAPGRGLAAPQVGEMVRVFVMDVGWKEGDMTPLACINPHIISASDGHIVGAEGCLSMPGVVSQVSRPAEIVLGFTDLQGQSVTKSLVGFAAKCAQHELDHLDGVMHVDRVDLETRTRILSDYQALS